MPEHRYHRYRAIADDLRRRTVADEFAPGALLPSEASLSAAYAASRITVRKALELLRDEGLVASRQGFGWFRATEPVRQRLAGLVTIEAELAESGVTSERRVLDFGFVRAPVKVRKLLDAERVLAVRRLNLAGGRPFAVVSVWCPESFGRSLSRDDVERTTFYDLLAAEVAGATQTIAAAAVSRRDGAVLGVPAGAPVLVCERVTYDTDGAALLVSKHVFPSHLTEFVVELPTGRPRFTRAGR